MSLHLHAGTTCLYDPLADMYTFVYQDGAQFSYTRSELERMTQAILGGLHGGYRTPTQTTHSSSSYGAYSGDPRVQAQITLAQSQLAAQLAISQQTANYLSGGGLTYSSTSGVACLNQFPTLTPEPPPIVKYEGIKSGEIIAYRCWLIKGLVRYWLTSCYVNNTWDSENPMTGNVGETDDYYYCGYGVHAFKTEKHALEYGKNWIIAYDVAFGRVKLWGEVVEHERGYRAENARIISIDRILDPKDDQRILRQLRKRYGVNEYANGNNTDSRQVGPGDGKEEGPDQGLGRDDLPSVPGDTRKGGCWNYLRGFIQGRRV